MKIRLVASRELSGSEIELWSGIQMGNADLVSPYFCPEFTLLTGQVRPNVYVGILEDADALVGFFPFEEPSRGEGWPVGTRLSDYQGLIVNGNARWSAAEIIAGCQLKTWNFGQLLASQTQFRQYCSTIVPSYICDLKDGFEAYTGRLKVKGSNVYYNTLVKERRITRDVGPLRYEYHVTEINHLNSLVECKSQQYKRTGIKDVFARTWPRELLHLIHSTQNEAFAGVLSVLYAGDEAVAWHMGMRSRWVLHWWFPCYCTKFAEYSPGLILFFRLAEAAARMGLKAIDLGEGDESYKLRLKTSQILVARGVVHSEDLVG